MKGWVRFRRLVRSNIQICLVVAALLVGLRVALPFIVKWYVNKTLDEMPEYDGRIGDVDMKLWRGAYVIQDIDIIKTDGDVPVPFFSSPRVEFAVQWRALFEGALVGQIKFFSPVINFVNGPSDETQQTGVDKPWLDVIKKLFPLDINRFEVMDGSVHYRDFSSKPHVDLALDQIHMLATNLTNSKKLSKTLVANLDCTGRAFKSSGFNLSSKLDPSTDKATFDLNFAMEPVKLTELNDFVEAYGKFDFEKGTLAMAIELAASDGKLTGYIKPVFDQVAVIDLKEDIKNPIKLVWEGFVGGVLRVFRNQPQNRLATKIPISGDLSDPKPAILVTLVNILKNEFIRAYDGKVENIVDLKNAEQASKIDARREKEQTEPRKTR